MWRRQSTLLRTVEEWKVRLILEIITPFMLLSLFATRFAAYAGDGVGVGDPSLFHTATSLLIWYKMFCMRDISYRLIWTSNGSWCMGIKGEMSGTVCVTFTWYMYIYELFIAFVFFCCLFIIVTTQFVALYKPCKPKPKPSTYDPPDKHPLAEIQIPILRPEPKQ